MRFLLFVSLGGFACGFLGLCLGLVGGGSSDPGVRQFEIVVLVVAGLFFGGIGGLLAYAIASHLKLRADGIREPIGRIQSPALRGVAMILGAVLLFAIALSSGRRAVRIPSLLLGGVMLVRSALNARK